MIARCVITLAEWWFVAGICHSKLDFNLRKKIVKCYIWSTALHGAETWKLWRVDQKYLEGFEMRLLEKDGEYQLVLSCVKMKYYEEPRRKGTYYIQ